MTEKVEMLFDAAPDSIDRTTIVANVARSFLLVDSTRAILEEGKPIPEAEANIMLTVLAQALSDSASIVGIQNSVTGDEYTEAITTLRTAAEAAAAKANQ